jgi:hypothetical protein
MDRLDKEKGLGEGPRDEHADRCLEALREIQKHMSDELTGRREIFDPGVQLGLGSERTVEGKLERLTRACIWHAVSLKHEFKLKLLYTIDGYLSAVDAKNPVSTFLLARYLLELVATVSAIDFELEASLEIDFRDWMRRGVAFLAPLFRARHSTSDPRFKPILSKSHVPASAWERIPIGKAIKQLATRPGFKAAVSMYDTLSNICHHNGSGHKFLAEDMRMTKSIVRPNGRRIFFKKKTAAATMAYPASRFLAWSLLLTARGAWWCAYSANEMIDELRETPFSDEELKVLTNGRLTNDQAARPIIRAPKPTKVPKVGRNDPCPCGSGKKYKACCLAGAESFLTEMVQFRS